MLKSNEQKPLVLILKGHHMKIPKNFEELTKHLNIKIIEVKSRTEFIQLLNEKYSQVFAIIYTMGIRKTDQELFNSLPKTLRLIACSGSGYDYINIEEAKNHNIWISNTPGITGESTSELALILLLSITRDIWRQTNLGNWLNLPVKSIDLENKKVGLIGLGEVGKEFLKKLSIFRTQNFYFKRSKLTKEGVQYLDFKKLISEMDIISIHIPLNKETHHLIDKEEFELMKPNTILINTSRGAIVNEKIMIEYLKNEKLAGVGLDVFEFEPSFDHKLLDFDNVIMLPHIGACTVKEMAIKNVENLIEKGIPFTPVNQINLN